MMSVNFLNKNWEEKDSRWNIVVQKFQKRRKKKPPASVPLLKWTFTTVPKFVELKQINPCASFIKQG